LEFFSKEVSFAIVALGLLKLYYFYGYLIVRVQERKEWRDLFYSYFSDKMDKQMKFLYNDYKKQKNTKALSPLISMFLKTGKIRF